MNTKQLKYALTLAKESSFSRAAELLGISQPSLSQYVKKIEQEVGAQLFSRIGGEVRLTDAGRAYIAAGRSILDIERRMEGTLSDLNAHKTGTVVIGTSPFRSIELMPSVARAFKELYPDVCLVVDEMESGKLADALFHGEVDLCLTPLPINEKLFTYEEIFTEELVLAVPTAWAHKFKAEKTEGRRHSAVSIRSLDGEPFVTITESQMMARALSELCENNGITVKGAVVVKSLAAQVAMVKAGLGLALLPSGTEALEESRDGIAYFSLKEETPCRKVVAVYRKDCPPSHLARDLIDTLKRVALHPIS